MVAGAFSLEKQAQEERLEEGLFYEAFKASPIGIALEDLEGRPLFVNPALCSMLGFTEQEMRRKHCIEFSPREDAEKDWALFQQLQAGSARHYQLEKRFFRRDGSQIWGRLSVSLLNNRAAPLVIAMVEDISEKKAAQERLSRSEGNLQKLAGKLIEAQEEERTRIARELHDDIHQQLVLVSASLDLVQQSLPDSAIESTMAINRTREHLENVSEDIHALSHSLYSSKLEYLGLGGAAASLCRELSSRYKMRINFSSQGICKNMSKEISLCLYRVLQESLQNAHKHSGSQHVEVSLNGGSNEVRLTVSDWGIGFDAREAMIQQGLGLASMRERVKLVGGEFSIESQPQRGTTIRARVSLNDRPKVSELKG